MQNNVRAPDYYKFPRELYEHGKRLPDTTAAKLYRAVLATFFDRETPNDLPERAADVLAGWDGRIKAARMRSDEKLSAGEVPPEQSASTERVPPEQSASTERVPPEQSASTEQPKQPANSADIPVHCAVGAQVVSTDIRYRDKREEKPPPIPESKPSMKEGGGEEPEPDFISEHLSRKGRP